jgi:ParB-like chromosome segregation protein Spo0J
MTAPSLRLGIERKESKMSHDRNSKQKTRTAKRHRFKQNHPLPINAVRFGSVGPKAAGDILSGQITRPRSEAGSDQRASSKEQAAPATGASQELDIDQPARTRSVFRLPIEKIIVTGARRECRPERVGEIAASLTIVGQLEPITVRRVAETVDGVTVSSIFLVDGLHRLKGGRLAGWDAIDAVFFEGDEVAARLCQLTVNLCRADLTQLERAEHVTEWVRLVDERAKVLHAPTPGGVQPADVGVRKAARELGLDPGTVSRLRKIDGLSPEAKTAAKSVGLDNTFSALLKAAEEPEAEQQVARVFELSRSPAVERPRRSATTKKGAGQDVGREMAPLKHGKPACSSAEQQQATVRSTALFDSSESPPLSPDQPVEGDLAIPAFLDRRPLSDEEQQRLDALTAAWCKIEVVLTDASLIVRDRFLDLVRTWIRRADAATPTSEEGG